MAAKKYINININNAFKKRNFIKNKKIEETKRLQEERKKEKQQQLKLEVEKRRLEEERLKQEEIKRREKELEKKLSNFHLKTYKIKLTTLSPIHIGDGEMFEPISYVIKDKFLYFFNEEFVLGKIIKKEQNINIEKLVNIETLVEFFKSYREFIVDNELYLYKVLVADDIAKSYEKSYGASNNDDESFNQMLIQKNIATINPYTNKYEPYVPGSSIKGALQTILNLSVEDSQKLKISDSIGKKVASQIAWSVRKTKKGTIPQKLEIISKGSTYAFEISKSDIFTFDKLKEKLNTFYKNADSIQYLNFEKEIKKENQFLLRIGRYVGQKFMSTEENIKTPKTKAMFRKKEKDEKSELNFGWVICEIL